MQVFETDLKQLEPAQRLSIMEKLMQYCIPKQQAIDIAAQVSEEYRALEALLKNAPDEAVQRIADKVVELQKISKS